MSCLNLRLPKGRKAWWKSLTSKIQSKLHKLNKPKTVTKPRNHRPKTPASRPSKFLGKRFKCKRSRPLQPPTRRLVLAKSSATRGHVLQKSHAPVYVDKLFKGTHVFQHLQNATSKEAGNGAELRACNADDMWEAMGFASPQMNGIDERAERFIAKFRAEMEVQEMLARDLLSKSLLVCGGLGSL